MFFTCSPFCIDPLHQHNYSDSLYSKVEQENLAETTIASLKKNSASTKKPETGKPSLKLAQINSKQKTLAR